MFTSPPARSTFTAPPAGLSTSSKCPSALCSAFSGELTAKRFSFQPEPRSIRCARATPVGEQEGSVRRIIKLAKVPPLKSRVSVQEVPALEQQFPPPDQQYFFQAEDGIRYYKVTGVQTCALPI